jgi:hypothetical protein
MARIYANENLPLQVVEELRRLEFCILDFGLRMCHPRATGLHPQARTAKV